MDVFCTYHSTRYCVSKGKNTRYCVSTMKKYNNKYRIETTRLKNWDYGWNGAYFITICTKNRIHYFGEIKNQKMQLSGIGKMAEKYWHEIPAHFPFVKLDAFIVMPNHIHGIIIIDKTNSDHNHKIWHR